MFLKALAEPGHKNFITCAAFHLGVPLVLAKAGDGSWPEIRGKIQTAIQRTTSKLVVCENCLPAGFRFPLGEPICLAFQNDTALKHAFSSRRKGHAYVGHQIWITPAGGVFLLIHGRALHPNSDGRCTFETEGYEDEYDTLVCVFLEIFEQIRHAIAGIRLRFSFAGSEILQRNMHAAQESQLARNSFFDGHGKLDRPLLAESHVCTADDLLYDVYYISSLATGTDSFEIGYGEAKVDTTDALDIYSILFSYLSFPTALWLMNAVSDYSKRALTAINGFADIRRLHTAKAMRTFCETFIAESQPIQIRISERYLERMEQTFTQHRIPKLFEQISVQLRSITEEVNSIESDLQALRDRRIALGASAIAIFSALSAGYDLLSYMRDFQNSHGITQYFLGAWMITLVVFFLVVLNLPGRRIFSTSFRLFNR